MLGDYMYEYTVWKNDNFTFTTIDEEYKIPNIERLISQNFVNKVYITPR